MLATTLYNIIAFPGLQVLQIPIELKMTSNNVKCFLIYKNLYDPNINSNNMK